MTGEQMVATSGQRPRPTLHRGARSAETQAVVVGAGTAIGLLLGVMLGIRMHAGEQRLRRRLTAVHDAWIILRN